MSYCEKRLYEEKGEAADYAWKTILKIAY